MLAILKETAQAYGEDNAPLLAAALAYFSVFSLAPLLLIVITVLVFFGAGDAQGAILEQVQSTVGAEGARLVESMIEGQAERGGGLLAMATSILVLFVAATTLFAQLERALNIIWKVEPKSETRLGGVKHLLMARVRSLGLILAIGLLFLIALFLTTVVRAIVSAVGEALPGGTAVWLMLNRGVAFAALVLVFGLVFTLLPNARAPWRAVAAGALTTAALFVVGSWAFGIYIANVAIDSAYGAAGSLVVLLLWVYVSAQVVLIGGELTQVLARRWGGDEALQRPAG